MNTNFIINNYLNIIFVIVFTFLFLAISQSKWNFNPNIPPPKLLQQITLETMENMDTVNSFCKSFLGDAGSLESACNRLTEESCSKTSCCVYTDMNKCVAGSKHGPTFKSYKDGNPIKNSFFYYLGEKN